MDCIPEVDGETNASVTDKVYDVIQKQMKISNARSIRIVRCHRLGQKRNNAKRPRQVIFKLHWFGDREAIWGERSKLKGTNYLLSEDFPAEILSKRRVLQPVMKEAWRQKKKATLAVDKLILEGEVYTVDTLHKLPKDLQPQHLATPSNEDGTMTAFFSSSSPLSNFHPGEFIDSEDNVWSYSECAYQYAKAREFGDHSTAEKIKLATSPLEAYNLGKNVKGFNRERWMTKAKDVMLEACKLKFVQNSDLKNFLIDTKESTLIEANPRDKVWAVGLSVETKMYSTEQNGMVTTFWWRF